MFDSVSTTKTCTKCGTLKPLSDFVKDRRNKDGRGPSCKKCKNSHDKEKRPDQFIRLKAWRQAHPERVAKKMRRTEKKYHATHPEQIAARRAVKYAISTNKLPRASSLKCIRCGNQARNYHHHNGYAKEHRLDVVPVCSPCHRFFDRPQ